MQLLLAQTDTDVDETLSELSQLTAGDWILAGSIVVAAFVIGMITKALVARSLTQRSGQLVANLIGRLGFAIVVAIGFVYSLGQVGVSIGPLLGLLGLLGLALALAFQEVLSNFIAGVMLSLQRPFKVGDEIRSAGYEGTVEDVSLRTVTLKTFDGVRVHIPNATVWEEPIENSTTLGTRRTTLAIGVGYPSDLDDTQRLIIETLEGVDGVRSEPGPQAFVEEFGDSSINFAIRFWHDPHVASEWAVRDEVARRLKQQLDRQEVEIPFPQLVLHNVNTQESASA